MLSRVTAADLLKFRCFVSLWDKHSINPVLSRLVGEARSLALELQSETKNLKLTGGPMVVTPANFSVNAQNIPPTELIVGHSPTMRLVRGKFERIAETTVPVVIQGENGTGKDVLVKLLHARSNRAKRAFVKVSCPTVPHSLIESELFGYEKGAFTGAFATSRDASNSRITELCFSMKSEP